MTGNLTGAGALLKEFPGTLILAGTNTFAGGTTIFGGTLQIGNGGATGTLGSGNVTNNAVLSFNRDNSANLVVANAISGTGSVTQAGTGTTILTATNTYSGATNVNGGTLQIDGVVTTSNITVNNGGTLSGTGKLGDPTINAGGTLAPGNAGNPFGTLTIADDLIFNAGSFFNVNVNAAGQASNVLLTNGADLVLNGGTVRVTYVPGGTYITRQYTLISGAQTITGTFAGLANTNLPPAFIASLVYSATDVKLDLTAVLSSAGGLNQNQQSLANAFNTFFNGGGALPPAFLGLFGLNGAALANALDQLSPQIYGASEIAALYASQQFTTDLMSCRTPGDGAASIKREGQCLWVKGRERVLDVASTGQDLGLHDRTSSVSAGLQSRLVATGAAAWPSAMTIPIRRPGMRRPMASASMQARL